MISQPIIVLLKLSGRGVRLENMSSRPLVCTRKESYFLWERLDFDLPLLPEYLLSDIVDRQWETFLVTSQTIVNADLFNKMKVLT